MADILTHLRELSFGYGILKCGELNFNDTPTEFLNYCQNNIANSEALTIKNISASKANFNDKELNAVKNGLKLAKLVLSKNIITSKSPVVNWIGGETQSGTASDITIDGIPFSLKENSFILHNMGLYQLVNIIIDKTLYKKGLHIFEKFALHELDEWFLKTRDTMIEKLKIGSYQTKDTQKRNIKLAYSASADKLYLFFYDNEELIQNFSTCDYERFKKDTTSKYREKVFSRFIKENLSDDKVYLAAKKNCSEMAGKNLVDYLNANIISSPSYKSLFNLFRIEKKEYYFAKTTDSNIELYKIPAQSEFLSKVKITNITSSVPKSQLNILTTIKNITTNKKLVVRNELRYSHGQLNGTPEAKMYVDEGSLLIAYDKV